MMTHEELLQIITNKDLYWFHHLNAVRAVAELHTPILGNTLTLCKECMQLRKVDDPVITYPCSTIQAIEKELK
jgi:hypothetical protein